MINEKDEKCWRLNRNRERCQIPEEGSLEIKPLTQTLSKTFDMASVTAKRFTEMPTSKVQKSQKEKDRHQ